MRWSRMALFVLLVLLAVAQSWFPAAARSVEPPPERSGTILGGNGVELGGGQPWEQPAAERSGCTYAVDCLAWLRSGCDPALAGHDPVLTASIVDVAGLADGRTPRSLELLAPDIPPWGLWPGAVIQFWRQDCTQVHDAKQHSIGSDSTCQWWNRGVRCSVVVPTQARWMTLSGYATTMRLSWTLA